jgi:hypothetical protein
MASPRTSTYHYAELDIETALSTLPYDAAVELRVDLPLPPPAVQSLVRTETNRFCGVRLESMPLGMSDEVDHARAGLGVANFRLPKALILGGGSR